MSGYTKTNVIANGSARYGKKSPCECPLQDFQQCTICLWHLCGREPSNAAYLKGCLFQEGGEGLGLNLVQVLHFSRRAAAQSLQARGKAGPHSTLITRRASFSCQDPGDQTAPVAEGCTERQIERGCCLVYWKLLPFTKRSEGCY